MSVHRLTSSSKQPPPPRLVLLIVADDLGYGDLSSRSHPWLRTPHLDKLRSESTEFVHFSVSAPVCSPSRAAALTGQHPARFCIHQQFAETYKNRQRQMPDWLDPKAPSLAAALKRGGYATAHFGKWHLCGGMIDDAPSGTAYGFDEYRAWTGPPPSIGWREVYDAALDFVVRQQVAKHKAFVWLALHETHKWHKPSVESMRAFSHLSATKPRQVYAAVVRDQDEGLGRLFEGIKRIAALPQNQTLTLYFSDNGPELTNSDPLERLQPDHSECADQGCELVCGTWCSVGSTGGLRGRKRSLFQGGLQTPFFVRWPGFVPAGRSDTTTVTSALDLAPTVLAATGLGGDADARTSDGENMLNAWTNTLAHSDGGGGGGDGAPRRLYWDWRGSKRQPDTWPRGAVREGHLKLLVGHDGQKELYDLASDPNETIDLKHRQPSVVARLEGLFQKWQRQLPSLEQCHARAGGAAAITSSGISAQQDTGTGADDSKATTPSHDATASSNVYDASSAGGKSLEVQPVPEEEEPGSEWVQTIPEANKRTYASASALASSIGGSLWAAMGNNGGGDTSWLQSAWAQVSNDGKPGRLGFFSRFGGTGALALFLGLACGLGLVALLYAFERRRLLATCVRNRKWYAHQKLRAIGEEGEAVAENGGKGGGGRRGARGEGECAGVELSESERDGAALASTPRETRQEEEKEESCGRRVPSILAKLLCLGSNSTGRRSFGNEGGGETGDGGAGGGGGGGGGGGRKGGKASPSRAGGAFPEKSCVCVSESVSEGSCGSERDSCTSDAVDAAPVDERDGDEREGVRSTRHRTSGGGGGGYGGDGGGGDGDDGGRGGVGRRRSGGSGNGVRAGLVGGMDDDDGGASLARRQAQRELDEMDTMSNVSVSSSFSAKTSSAISRAASHSASSGALRHAGRAGGGGGGLRGGLRGGAGSCSSARMGKFGRIQSPTSLDDDDDDDDGISTVSSMVSTTSRTQLIGSKKPFKLARG